MVRRWLTEKGLLLLLEIENGSKIKILLSVNLGGASGMMRVMLRSCHFETAPNKSSVTDTGRVWNAMY